MTSRALTKILILALMINAGVVFCILASGNTCWELIVLYWFTLTVKNYLDWRNSR